MPKLEIVLPPTYEKGGLRYTVGTEHILCGCTCVRCGASCEELNNHCKAVIGINPSGLLSAKRTWHDMCAGGHNELRS